MKDEGGFAVKLMLKDLGLAIEAAKDSGTPTPLGAIAQALYTIQAKKASHLDFSSILQLLQGD